MIDRKILKLNTSTATSSTSAGNRKDAEGHQYAIVDLQLPSNLMGNITRAGLPKKIEMSVSRFNIPLNNLVLARVPLVNYDLERGARTKGIMTLWPFTLDSAYDVTPGNWEVQHPFIFDNTGEGRFDYPIEDLYLPFPCPPDTMQFRHWVQENTQRNQTYPIHDFNTVLKALTTMHGNLLHRLLTPSLPYIYYSFKNGKFTIESGVRYDREQNLMNGVLPYGWWAEPLQCGVQLPVRAVAGENTYTHEGVTLANVRQRPYSIVVNQTIRDIFPTLPWKRIDLSRVKDREEAITGRYIENWKTRNNHDHSDTAFILSTDEAVLSFETDPCWYEAFSSFGENPPLGGGSLHPVKVSYTFENVNPISFCDITSFIIVAQGLPGDTQFLPVNIPSEMVDSSITTNFPVLEVYYPLWQSLSDLSTNMVLSRDNFTNTALIDLPPSALTERNISFQVYMYHYDGTLSPLTLLPDQHFSLQLTFALYR